MLTDEQIDAIEIREPSANDIEFSYTTPELFKLTKVQRPLVYKVLKVNNLLDETKSEPAMADLIYSINLSLWGDKAYEGLVDFSIFEIEEIESMINEAKETLKNLIRNENKAEFAKKDYEDIKKNLENHIKFLEGLIAKKNQKQ